MKVHELIVLLKNLPSESIVMVDIGQLMTEEFDLKEGFFYTSNNKNKYVAITLVPDTINDLESSEKRERILEKRNIRAKEVLDGIHDEELY